MSGSLGSLLRASMEREGHVERPLLTAKPPAVRRPRWCYTATAASAALASVGAFGLMLFAFSVGLPRFRGHLPSLSRHDERGVHEIDEVVQAAQAPQVHA
jgi:hypothetical protein